MSDTPNAAPATPAGSPSQSSGSTAVGGDAKGQNSEAAREAEYRAAMAKARGEEPKEPKARQKTPAVPEPQGRGEQEEGEQEEREGDGADEGEGGEQRGEKDDGGKTWSLKFNGKEKVVKSENELVALAQKGLASTEKFEQASRVQKQAMQFLEALRENPLAVLTHPKLGMDPAKLRTAMEKWLYEKVSYESLPEEERQKLDEKKELERLREREKAREIEASERRKAELKERFQRDMTQKFIQTLEGGDVPVNDFTVGRMSQYMRAALKRGMRTIQPGDVIDMVRQDWETVQRQIFQRYDGEKLLKVVGEEGAKKIRRADLAKLEGGGNAQAGRDPAPRAPAPPQASAGPSFSSAEELRDYLTRRRA